MKICSNCNTTVPDDATSCHGCGAIFTNPDAPTPPCDPYDHTAEFDAKDISDNKVVSMLVYLMGWFGIIIALLASHTSPYAAFHVRQALKFTVIEILAALCMALLCWTVIVPIAYGVFAVILFVVRIICFFDIRAGKAKEPPIVRGFKFLK